MDFQVLKMWAAIACARLILLQITSGADVALTYPCTPGKDSCSSKGAECLKFSSSCDKGVCSCPGEYRTVPVNGAPTCKMKKNKGDNCDAATDACVSGTECEGTPTQCTCPNGTRFNDNLEKCISNILKPLGGVCNTVGDCYTDGSLADAVECEMKENGGNDKYCQCKAYYKMDNFRCRLPAYGERCENPIGCSFYLGPGTPNNFDAVEEICNNSTAAKKCVCPAGSTYRTFDMISPEMIMNNYGVCVANTNETLKGERQPCDTMNQCEAGLLCQTCPGENAHRCIKAGRGSGATVTVSLSLIAFSLLLRFG